MTTLIDLKNKTGDMLPDMELEYRCLLKAIRSTRNRFHIFPVESNLQAQTFIHRLTESLSESGDSLRVVRLNRETVNLFDTFEMKRPIEDNECVLLVGLEDTPNLLSTIGQPLSRGTALYTLNLQREQLRRALSCPFMILCTPFIYDALIRDAPDIFDQATATFHLLEPTKAPLSIELASDFNSSPKSQERVEAKQTKNQQNIRFYEDQVKKSAPGTRAFARAQFGLGFGLQSESSGDRDANLRRAIACYEAALRVTTEAAFPQDWAMTLANKAEAMCHNASNHNDPILEEALSCLKQVESIFQKDKFPEYWSGNQVQFGMIYQKMGDLERATEFYKRGVEGYRSSGFDTGWKMLDLAETRLKELKQELK